MALLNSTDDWGGRGETESSQVVPLPTGAVTHEHGVSGWRQQLRVSPIDPPGDSMPIAVRASDICVPDVEGLDVYRQGLRLVSEYSQRDGHLGKVLRVEPEDVSRDALQQGLKWLYAKLAEQEAHYASEPATRLGFADEPRLRSAWHALRALRARGVAWSPTQPGMIWRVQLQEDGTLLLPAHCRERSLEVRLEGFIGVYSFTWYSDQDGKPCQLDLLSRRNGRRARVSARVRAAIAALALVADRQLAAGDLAVCDVSLRGVGLACDAAHCMIFPGQRFEGLQIRWKGGLAIECDATVAHVSPRGASGYDRCGLVLDFRGRERERERWHALVEPLLHPRTVVGTVPARALLRAYKGSGYLSLSGKRPEDFAEQQRRFSAAQDQLRGAADVGACIAAGDAKRLEAFCHQLQLWPGSWLFYHLCRLPDGRSLGTSDDGVLVDLYARAYDYIQQQPDCRWLVTYIQVDAGYSHRVHYQGALDLSHLGGVAIVRVQVLEVECSGGAQGGDQQRTDVANLDPAVTVESADPATAEQVRGALAERYPNEYLQATGLGEPELGLGALAARWSEGGLERLRRVTVVKRAGQIIAVGVFDAATPGLHLYGLLDCARIFVLTPGAEVFTRSLLADAAEWYGQLGRDTFAYFRELSNPEGVAGLAAKDLGEAFVVAQTAKHIPLLIERVFALAAPTLAGVPERSDAGYAAWAG